MCIKNLKYWFGKNGHRSDHTKFHRDVAHPKILQDIIARGIEKKKRDLKIVGGFAFTLEKLCVCDRSCGGIMCRAINVFTLKGNSW